MGVWTHNFLCVAFGVFNAVRNSCYSRLDEMLCCHRANFVCYVRRAQF